MRDKPLYFLDRRWYTTGNNGFRREKKTMAIQLLKKNNAADGDMDEYRKNLRGHRLRITGLWAGVFAIIVIGALGIRSYLAHRVFSDYEVVLSYDRSDTMNTRYTEFQNYVLKYGSDGISCVDNQNKTVWSQTYNMQNPIVSVRGKSAAVAEKNGTEAMVFDSTGLQGKIQTSLPIRNIEVSSQGVLAVLVDDDNVTRLYVYDKSGEQLVEAKFELQDTGYPMGMSLSSDATKLAVSFLQVNDGSVNSCLAFYNFGSVGENASDNLVASEIISGEIIPSVRYLDSTHCYAVGTGGILLYNGTQIPEKIAEIPTEQEIESVFWSDDALGVVVEGTEKAHELRVYDNKGNTEYTLEFDLDYSMLKFSGENLLIYNDFDCMMVNRSGNVFFEGTFDESISNIYSISGNIRYMVMHASRTDQIHLK